MNAVLSDAPLGALWSSDFKRGSVGFVTLLPNSSLRGYFFYSFAPSVKSLIACLNGIETVRSASSYFNNIFKKKQKTNQQKINLVGFFYNILSFNMSLDTKSYQLWYLSAAVGPSPPSFSPNSTGWLLLPIGKALCFLVNNMSLWSKLTCTRPTGCFTRCVWG